MYSPAKHSCLILLLCLLTSFAKAQAPCLNITGPPDDSICQGGCAALTVGVTGPLSTTSYTVQPVPYAPYPYTGGNPILVNLDDLWSPVINIPFCFEFYGNVYNQLVVGTNGLVSFDISQANGACPWTISAAIPNPAMPMNAIMAPHHDINPMLPTSAGQTEISWQVYGTAPCRSMVISWNDVAQFGVGCDTTSSTCQVVLYETTFIIDIFIADKPLCTAWNSGAAIEGLHNAFGTLAVTPLGRNYPSAWSATSDGMRFAPNGPAQFTVQWLDPSNNVVSTGLTCMACPTVTSTYTVNVTFTFCSGPPLTLSDQVTVFVIPTTLAGTSSYTDPLCQGVCDGTMNVNITSGSPPYTYNWYPASANLPSVPNQTGICPGTYTCVVTDQSGCSVQFMFNLTEIVPFNLSTSNTPTTCGSNTGSATINVSTGSGTFTYQWSTGDTTQTISNLPAGSYQVVVVDSIGCIDSVIANIGSSGLQLTVQGTTLLCFGDTNATATVNTLSGTFPFTYQWMPYGGNQATAVNLGAGQFVCIVTDSIGCSSTALIQISSPPPMVVSPSSNATICFGESVTISATVLGGTGPYSYAWSHNLPNAPSHVITPSQTDAYTIQVTDANGCVSPLQTTQVKVTPLPVADFFALEPTCPPAEVAFTNMTDTAVIYQWYFGDPASGASDTSALENPTHVYNASGTYTVTLIATNVWGCSDTIVAPIAPVPATPLASVDAAEDEITITDAQASFINYSQGGAAYCIYFGDGDSLCTTEIGPYPHTYDSIGTYTVMLVTWNALGCPDTAYTTISVEEPTTCYIPNAFTPNGMGENNEFMVYGVNIEEFELRVYDRWGMLLFTTTDIYNGWDGTFQGHKCQEDVYVWKLTYLDNFGNQNVRYGHVSLIR